KSWGLEEHFPQSFTTTMVIESKNGEAGHPQARVTKRTATDDLYTTFSSPMAWILVVALVVTWSCVAIVMFDLMDYKGLTGVSPPPAVRKVIKDAGRSRGSIQHISSDPMKVVNVAVEESTDWGKLLLAFVSSLVAPEEEEIEGIFHKLSLELP
uniref:Triadin n=1 Tax=Salmo trutta TaxID=8032 RepID=A0A673YC56_SALTR